MQRSKKRRSRVDSPNYRPRYRRHDSGQARVTIAGRDIYLGPYGTTESHAAYDRVIEEWLAIGRQLPRTEAVVAVAPPPPDEEPITVLELLAEYWKMLDEEGHLARWSGTSQLGNFRQAIKPLRELYPTVLADEFGPKRNAKLRAKRVRLLVGHHIFARSRTRGRRGPRARGARSTTSTPTGVRSPGRVSPRPRWLGPCLADPTGT